jgi:hypothetical protein
MFTSLKNKKKIKKKNCNFNLIVFIIKIFFGSFFIDGEIHNQPWVQSNVRKYHETINSLKQFFCSGNP